MRTAVILLWLASNALAQSANLPLSNLNVGAHDPLYTTYAAPLSRSEYLVDEGYFLNYFSPADGVTYTTDSSGSFALGWRLGKLTAIPSKDFYKQPVIHRSYSDLVEVEYWPFTTIQVREIFDVYSSRFAILNVEVTNWDTKPQELTCYAHYERDGPISSATIAQNQYVTFAHHIDAKTWSETPPPQFDPDFRDIFFLSTPADDWGGYAQSADLTRELQSSDKLNRTISGSVRGFILATKLKLASRGKQTFRIIRGVQPTKEDPSKLVSTAQQLINQPLAPIVAESEQQYARIPRACRGFQGGTCVRMPSPDWELAYWSAFTQVRQQMMPLEAQARTNYYLFSREPTWSWGHDGQVFHESIVMQAYAYMDPQSAQDSQRIFMDRQRSDGYIGYRIGPYVTRTFPRDGEDTTSAPFFSWTNWEIYRISHDRKFLEDAYRSGTLFAEYILRTRDKDHDGYLEWGGNAMLENVRDSLDVIWNLFGGDDDSPKRVKALDLMCMMVKETRSLALMAAELGRVDEQRQWNARADKLAELVRTRMWDEQSGFFYNLARDSGTFISKSGIDLRRKEIIGFLPLWAGIATKEQAARLAKHAADPASFNRRFGMPTLAADDPYYDPQITRCCQWNGAVWLLWDYMVVRGLLDYGYRPQAEQIVQHAMDGVLFHLRNDHRLWESYSPDYTQIASPKNYVWDGIIARMMIELYGMPSSPRSP